MKIFEITLGTLGKLIDSFFNWQFSDWCIALPMCIVEIVIATIIYHQFRSVIM